MNELELTKICAEWLGLSHYVYNNKVFLEKDWEGRPQKHFDPLHDWNDLMTKVVPKLLKAGFFIIHLTQGETFVITSIRRLNFPEGKFPDDLPRAVLELVKELKESNGR